VIGIIFLFLGTTLSQAIKINTHLESITNNGNSDTLEEKSIVSCRYFTLHGVEQIEREISLQDSIRISKLMNGSYIEAIACELTNLGLVPSSINSEQLRELISGEYGKKVFAKYTDKINHVVSGDSETKQNLFCTINGEAYSYVSRNLRAQLVAYIIVYPTLALFFLEFILHLLPKYPLIPWMKYENLLGEYIDLGIFGTLGWILLTIGETSLGIMDNRLVKLSMFQTLQLNDAYPSQVLPRLNTSSVSETWELSGYRIDTFMMGFFGIWFTIQNPRDEITKFRGFSMFINAESHY
jgi:hypothetical protein